MEERLDREEVGNLAAHASIEDFGNPKNGWIKLQEKNTRSSYECVIENKLSKFSFHVFYIVIFCDMIKKADIGSIAELSCQKDY